MNNQKGIAPIAIILIIIGILVLGGGAWYYSEIQKINKAANQKETPSFSPTSQPSAAADDETRDWKTYRNKEYGFEFKYPEQIIYPENGTRTLPPQEDVFGYPGLFKWEAGTTTDITFYLIPNNKSDPEFVFSGQLFPVGFHVSVYGKDHSSYYNIDSHQQKLLEQSGNKTEIKKTEITINGILGAKTLIKDENTERIYIELPKNDLIIGISYLRLVESNKYIKLENKTIQYFEDKIIQQILSTFKFIP